MKRYVLAAIILGLATMVVKAAPAMADWAGVSQCFINGKWVTVKGNCPVSGGSGSGSSSGPSYDYEAERQRQEAEYQRQLEMERQRQQEIEEQRRREEAETKRRQEEFERNKRDALNSMKGISEGELGLKGTDSGGLGLKEIGDTGKGDLGLKGLENNQAVPRNSVKESKAKAKKVQKGWQKALGCAMEEVYARAETFGPAGVHFSKKLRNEMTRVFNEAGKKVKDKDDVNIVDLKLDRQVSVGSGSAERQFIVEAAVHSKGDGNVDVDVQSYFSKSAGKKNKKDKQENLQSFIVINKSGEVIMGENSAEVDACLKR